MVDKTEIYYVKPPHTKNLQPRREGSIAWPDIGALFFTVRKIMSFPKKYGTQNIKTQVYQPSQPLAPYRHVERTMLVLCRLAKGEIIEIKPGWRLIMTREGRVGYAVKKGLTYKVTAISEISFYDLHNLVIKEVIK